ncbi:MAG: hypothetical protein ABSA27_11925 [Terriglobales bacterium]|jgi:hypothetical protein
MSTQKKSLSTQKKSLTSKPSAVVKKANSIKSAKPAVSAPISARLSKAQAEWLLVFF